MSREGVLDLKIYGEINISLVNPDPLEHFLLVFNNLYDPLEQIFDF